MRRLGYDARRRGLMKTFLFAAVSAVLALCCLSACTKDDLSNVDIKMDGSVKTSISTGSLAPGVQNRTRVGIGF